MSEIAIGSVVEVSVKNHRPYDPPFFPFWLVSPYSKPSLTSSAFGLVSLQKEENDRKWAAEKQITNRATNGLSLGPRTVIRTTMLV